MHEYLEDTHQHLTLYEMTLGQDKYPAQTGLVATFWFLQIYNTYI